MNKRLRKSIAVIGMSALLGLAFSIFYVLVFMPESPLRFILTLIVYPGIFSMAYFEESRAFPKVHRIALAFFFTLALPLWLAPLYVIGLPQFLQANIEPSIVNGLLTASSICFAFTATLFMREKTFKYHIITLLGWDIASFFLTGYFIFFFGLNPRFGLYAVAMATSSFSINVLTAIYLFSRHALKLELKIEE